MCVFCRKQIIHSRQPPEQHKTKTENNMNVNCYKNTEDTQKQTKALALRDICVVAFLKFGQAGSVEFLTFLTEAKVLYDLIQNYLCVTFFSNFTILKLKNQTAEQGIAGKECWLFVLLRSVILAEGDSDAAIE